MQLRHSSTARATFVTGLGLWIAIANLLPASVLGVHVETSLAKSVSTNATSLRTGGGPARYVCHRTLRVLNLSRKEEKLASADEASAPFVPARSRRSRIAFVLPQVPSPDHLIERSGTP